MPDFIDELQENNTFDKQVSANISRIREQAAKAVRQYTHCLYCNDPTEGGAPYCCKECGEDYERLQKARR